MIYNRMSNRISHAGLMRICSKCNNCLNKLLIISRLNSLLEFFIYLTNFVGHVTTHIYKNSRATIGSIKPRPWRA